MAMIKPTQSDYDPDNDLQQVGEFTAQVVRVQQGLRSPEFEGSKPSVAIEFSVYSPGLPECDGKHVSFMAGESIWRSKSNGRPSRLLAFAEESGAKNPEAGFDPQSLVSKWFIVFVEYRNSRYWVYRVVPTEIPPEIARLRGAGIDAAKASREAGSATKSK